MQPIRKAVIPAAGYGTRFLPATKASPKEMMPIVDKPIIQYVVEEAVSAGITDIGIVTSWQKRSIEDHFDFSFELEKQLQDTGKIDKLKEIQDIANLANFYYIRQKGPLGNATPIWNAREFIGDDPFIVLWGDDFIKAQPKSRCQQLIETYQEVGGSVIVSSIRSDKPSDYNKYGYAAGKEINDGVLHIDKIVEKPGPGNIDSDYAVVSGYIFTPEIIPAIEKAMQEISQSTEKNREVHYIDAINILLKENKDCYAKEIVGGKFYDCGNKLEYVKTIVEFSLEHPEIKKEFKKYLKNLTI